MSVGGRDRTIQISWFCTPCNLLWWRLVRPEYYAQHYAQHYNPNKISLKPNTIDWFKFLTQNLFNVFCENKMAESSAYRNKSGLTARAIIYLKVNYVFRKYKVKIHKFDFINILLNIARSILCLFQYVYIYNLHIKSTIYNTSKYMRHNWLYK